MKIKKETSRRIAEIEGYKGVCNGCGGQVEYEEPQLVVELIESETPERRALVPIDIWVCPHCNQNIGVIFQWKNMNITEELQTIRI